MGTATNDAVRTPSFLALLLDRWGNLRQNKITITRLCAVTWTFSKLYSLVSHCFQKTERHRRHMEKAVYQERPTKIA